MLILKRKPGQAIIITVGDTVVKVRNLDGADHAYRHAVFLGIEAPEGVIVDREEIDERKRKEMKS